MSPKTARRIGTAIVALFMAGSLVLSFTHIAHLFELLGLTTGEQWLAPLFIDTYMVLGKLMQMKCWTPKTRKYGLRVVMIGAGLSFACNIAAGGSAGGRILGALVVAGFLTGEWLITTMIPTAAARAATKPAAKKATAKCAKNCTCGKHRRSQVRALNAQYNLAAAPVSPAPQGA